MLEGKGPLYLPPYSDRAPVEYSVRCFCGARYLIFNPQSPGVFGDAESRARARAGQMHVQFINSELEPFVMWVCGQALDFTAGESVELVM
jgi:hypothetical protein